MNLIRREPVAVFGALQVALLAAIGVLNEFDVWDPTEGQVTALVALYGAVTALVTMFLRGRVSPSSPPE